MRIYVYISLRANTYIVCTFGTRAARLVFFEKKTSRCSLDLVQNEGDAVKIIFKSCKHISSVYILATLRETLFESLCYNLASMAYCNGRTASPIMLWQRTSKHSTHPHLPSLQFVSNKAKIGMRNPASLVLTTCLFINNLSCSR